MNSFSSTRILVLCGLFAAIMCVLAPLAIPLAGGVPISLATFVSMLSGVVLGGPQGAVSQLVYVLLGAVGLPVFAGWTGGIGIVLGMTGGYIVGYIVLAYMTGAVYHGLCRSGQLPQRQYPVRIFCMAAGMIAGTILLYTLGTAWFMFSTGMTLSASLAVCVIPFLPGDLLKMCAVAVIAPPLEAAVRRAVPAGGSLS